MKYGSRLALQDELNHLADDVDNELNINSRVQQGPSFKRSGRQGKYDKLKSSSASAFTERFGLSVDLIAENVQGGSNVRLHFTEDEDKDPMEVAREYSEQDLAIYDDTDVMAAAKTILSIELGRHPLIRRAVREHFRKYSVMTVEPTERGVSKIDDQHPYFNFKYLRPKPVDDIVLPPPPQYSEADLAMFAQARQRTPALPLPSQVQYLMALQAQAETLVKLNIGLPAEAHEALIALLTDAWVSDGVSDVSQTWNALRKDIVADAVREHLLPMGNTWIREWLREECKEWVAVRPPRP